MGCTGQIGERAPARSEAFDSKLAGKIRTALEEIRNFEGVRPERPEDILSYTWIPPSLGFETSTYVELDDHCYSKAYVDGDGELYVRIPNIISYGWLKYRGEWS
jgi:hypothetical protein